MQFAAALVEERVIVKPIRKSSAIFLTVRRLIERVAFADDVRHRLHFLVVDPHVAGLARAAVAALRAEEA